jgi:predicted RNase H-like nuclease (RuvC/YqgF family)
MSKTIKKPNPKEEKLNDIQKLRNKLSDRKQQIRRLKSYIRELEKKLENVGKPVTESKMDKPKKPETSKKVSPEDKAIFAREELKRKLKEQFGRKNVDG